MNVLSLFDGISCGMAALKRAGIAADNYIAYEIDKFAIQTSAKNYPEIVRRGDVFGGDFYISIAFLITYILNVNMYIPTRTSSKKQDQRHFREACSRGIHKEYPAAQPKSLAQDRHEFQAPPH